MCVCAKCSGVVSVESNLGCLSHTEAVHWLAAGSLVGLLDCRSIHIHWAAGRHRYSGASSESALIEVGTGPKGCIRFRPKIHPTVLWSRSAENGFCYLFQKVFVCLLYGQYLLAVLTIWGEYIATFRELHWTYPQTSDSTVNCNIAKNNSKPPWRLGLEKFL